VVSFVSGLVIMHLFGKNCRSGSQIIYMSQNIIQLPRRICFKCSHEENIGQTLCPRCGGQMRTPRNIRVRGFILTLLSGFLIVFMSWIAFYIYNVIQQSNKPGAGARFTGSQEDLVMIIAVFGLVILFGAIGLITGLWQVIFGRRNKILVYILLAIGVVLFIGSFVIRFYIGK
jgi:hypothetical protein